MCVVRLDKLNRKIIQSISMKTTCLDVRDELGPLKLTGPELTCLRENPVCLPLSKLSAAMKLLGMYDEIFDLCCFPLKSCFSKTRGPQQDRELAPRP